jgi:hypothetical protein
MNNGSMDVECPFCGFFSFDYTYVTEHIERCHLDDGPDFFQSVNNLGPLRCQSDINLREVSGSRNARFEVKYIQCECGDHVQLSDFTSHSAIHFTEEKTPPLSKPSRRSPIFAKPSTSPATNSDYQLRAHANHHVNSEQGKVQQPARGINGIYVGSSSSNARHCISKPRHAAPRRLGVMLFAV